MKLCLATLALLGLPATLAAVAAEYYTDSDPTPTRPDCDHGLPNPTSFVISDTAPQADKVKQEHEDWVEGLLHIQARDNQKRHRAASSSVASSSASSTATSSSSSSASSSAASTNHKSAANNTTSRPSTITEYAVFTAIGLPFTVTSAHGSELVDGKILVKGGAPAIIGGAKISEATNGNLHVDGTRITFTTASTMPTVASSPSTTPASTSVSSAAASSSSSSSSSTGTSKAGAAMPTRAVGVGAAAVGALIGVLVL